MNDNQQNQPFQSGCHFINTLKIQQPMVNKDTVHTFSPPS